MLSMLRSINTGLEGKMNYNILKSLEGQLSDGIWENSSAMEQYWKYMEIQLNENDEVIINIGKVCDMFWIVEGGFRNRDEAWIKKWLANKIKQIVKTECEDHNEEFKFNNENENKLRYMRDYYNEGNIPTVKDVYNAYKILIK